MKVIQITDDDAKALLTDIELAKFRDPGWMVGGAYNIPEDARKQLTSDLHRFFHMYVTRWLQKHGANVTS